MLKSDLNGSALQDKEIKNILGTSCTTIEKCRKQYFENGIEIAINRKMPYHEIPKTKLDGEQEAKLIAIVMSASPEGRDRWTLRLS